MIDRVCFPLTEHLNKGDRVTVVRRHGAPVSGAIELIWLGIEETVRVRCDDGTQVNAYPALGDAITVVKTCSETLDQVLDRIAADLSAGTGGHWTENQTRQALQHVLSQYTDHERADS